MARVPYKFETYPVLSWTIDDWEQFHSALKEENPNFDFQQYLKDYNDYSFKKINVLFEDAPFKLNLGGQTEKTKLISTDKPIGIFDFSSASRGMYRVPEYFSQKLADEYPDKFKEFQLPSGVVPSNLVNERVVNGKKVFVFEDTNGVFDCIIRQKGETAILDGVPGAKLKFATKNKKVFLTHKRNKGKVKYVEIYSLFYYTSLSGDIEYAIRHIPAMMVADYLESIGVMTRIYMTRFVVLGLKNYSTDYTLRKETTGGVELPMYKAASNPKFKTSLFVQPIIAKEFGQEFDKSIGFMISSDSSQKVYKTISEWAIQKEVIEYIYPYGEPRWEQNEYFEGIERYRNKYQEYVKLGLFKSKEVLPEAMMFFHDIPIKTYLSEFCSQAISYTGKTKEQSLIDININPFFNWWMRLSANTLKHKIDIVNSRELRKDLEAIKVDLGNFIVELKDIIVKANPNLIENGVTLPDFLKEMGNNILGTNNGYSIIDKRNNLSFKKYIQNITLEITTYAEGLFFATEEDRREIRDELYENVEKELINF
jgi:hypothetical protein